MSLSNFRIGARLGAGFAILVLLLAELSSTAEEMASQAESLQQLMAFFQVTQQLGQARFAPVHAPHPAPHAALAHVGLAAPASTKPAKGALPAKKANGAKNGATGHGDAGGFTKF